VSVNISFPSIIIGQTPVSIGPPYAIMRCPSYVSRACFVTAAAIDLQLCAYDSQTKFRSDLIPGLATRGLKPKTKSAMTPELMAGSSPNCYHNVHLIRIHDILPRFLI
jgi:hypothetical protein